MTDPENSPGGKDGQKSNRSTTHIGRGDIQQAGRDYVNNSTYALAHEPLPVPRQLPSRIRGFVNRTDQLSQLNALLDHGELATRAIAVVGTPGVGKTALALHWAHSTQSEYPDGSLYVNLRGYDSSSPVDASDALDGLLRSFDISPDRIPSTQQGREGLYRALLAERRVLILLDNAASASQVRPLLPGAGDCGVLITSRSRLPGLSLRDDVATVNLEVLPADEAVSLLVRLIGERAVRNGDATDTLARLCVYLPLALRIVAERVRLRPEASLVDIVDELRASSGQLDWLTLDEEDELTSLRGVFSWSYHSLPTASRSAGRSALRSDSREMFCFLGLHHGPDISVQAAGALVGVDTPEARRLLDSLLNANLIESTGPERYEMHDLLKAYARECAASDIPQDRARDAVRRELEWYLHAANAADEVLAPQRRHVPEDNNAPPRQPLTFTDFDEAIQWCEDERLNCIAMVRRAAEDGEYDLAWKLPLALNTFFHIRWYLDDWAETAALGVAAARSTGDPFATAWSLTGLGGANESAAKWPLALGYYEESLTLWREAGDRPGEALGLLNTGGAYREVGRLDESMVAGQAALVLARQLENQRLVGLVFHLLGQTFAAMGDPAKAMESFTGALLAYGESINPHGQGQVLSFIANLHRDNAHLDEALANYSEALRIQRRIGDRQGEGISLLDLGRAYFQSGRKAEAKTASSSAREIFLALNETRLLTEADELIQNLLDGA